MYIRWSGRWSDRWCKGKTWFYARTLALPWPEVSRTEANKTLNYSFTASLTFRPVVATNDWDLGMWWYRKEAFYWEIYWSRAPFLWATSPWYSPRTPVWATIGWTDGDGREEEDEEQQRKNAEEWGRVDPVNSVKEHQLFFCALKGNHADFTHKSLCTDPGEHYCIY